MKGENGKVFAFFLFWEVGVVGWLRVFLFAFGEGFFLRRFCGVGANFYGVPRRAVFASLFLGGEPLAGVAFEMRADFWRAFPKLKNEK